MATDLFASSEGLDVAAPVAGADLFADPNAPGPLKRGFGAGVAGLKASAYGAGALLARGATAVLPDAVAPITRGLEAAALENVKAQSDLAAAQSMSFEDVLADPTRSAEYFKFLLGQAVPSLATMAVGGGLGALAGRAIAGQAGLVAARAAGVVAPAVRAGALTGAVVPDVAMEAGSIYPEALQTGVENPGTRALVGGAAAGALDFVPLLAAEKYLKPVGKGLTGGALWGARAKGAIRGAPVGAAMEGSQEMLQSVVERAAAGKSLTDPEAVSDYIESLLSGAAPGVIFGAGIGARRQSTGVTIGNTTGLPVQETPPSTIPEQPPVVNDPNLGATSPNLGTPLPTSSPAEMGDYWGAQYLAATDQLAALEPAVAEAQTAHDALVSRRDALAEELKLPVGERRTKSEILTERKAVNKELEAAKKQMEALGGQLHSTRATIADLEPRLEASARQVIDQGQSESTGVIDQSQSVPNTIVPPEGLNPAIAPKTDPLVSTTIADPNAPVVPEHEQIKRAVTGVQTLMRERGLLHDMAAADIPTDPRVEFREAEVSLKELSTQTGSAWLDAERTRRVARVEAAQQKLTPREVALAREGRREVVSKDVSSEQMKAVEDHAMTVIEPLAMTLAKTKTDTPGGQQKIAKAMTATMRGVVQEAAKQPSVEAAQQYITDKLPNALKGHGVAVDAADMAKVVSAAVGQAKTQYSKGAVEPGVQIKPSLMKDQPTADVKAGYVNFFKNPVHLAGDGLDGMHISGFTDPVARTTFHGYDKNGERFTIRAANLKPENIVSSRDSNRTANSLRDAVAAHQEQIATRQSNAALTQDEFDTLPEPAKFAAVDEFNRVMREKGTTLRTHLTKLIGDRPELVVKTFMATPGSPIGSYTRVGPYKAVVSLALNAKSELGVADHEGFHYAEDWLLTAAERRVVANGMKPGRPIYNQLVARLQQYDQENKTNLTDEVTGVPAEARAYGFEFWRRGELQADGPIARIWQKIAQFLERVANLVKGNGFTSLEDVFTALDRGQFAERMANSGEISEIAGEFQTQESQAATTPPKYQPPLSEEFKRELAKDPEAARQFAEWRKANEYWQAVQEGQGARTQFSRGATAEMDTRFQNGELEQIQQNRSVTKFIEDANSVPWRETIKRVGLAPEYEGMKGGLSRWWNDYMSTPNFISAFSKGFANVYRTLNTFQRYRDTLVERMLKERIPEWYKASFADQDAAFGALLKRTVEKYRVDSLEYQDLMRTLTPEQKRLFDQATSMIAGFLDAQFAVDREDYKEYLTSPGAYDKWFTSREAQVQEMKDNGYVPLRRYGDHTVRISKTVTGEDNVARQETVALEMFRSPDQAELAARIYQAEAQRQGLDYSIEVGIKQKNARESAPSVQQFLNTLRRQGVEVSQTERECLVMTLTNSESMLRNQMMRREGTPGFSKDGMRVLNEFGMNTAAQIAYSKFGSAIDAVAEGRDVEADIDANGNLSIKVDYRKQDAEGEYESIDDYKARNLWKIDGPKSGYYFNRAAKLIDFVLVPDHSGEWSRNARAAAMVYFIGGSISSAAVNVMSIPMLLVPQLSVHTGYSNGLTTAMGAWKQTWQHQAILRDITRLKDAAANPMPEIDNVPGLRDALIAAADKLQDTELHQIMGISQGQLFAQSRAVRRAMDVWMAPFRISEQTNRITSFIAGYKIGQGNGLKGQELFTFARNMVDSTQNNYSLANRPGIASTPIGAMLIMFKSFPLFMVEAAVLMYKASPRSAIFMLLGLVALTGVQGLPFAETLENLIDTIAQRIFNSPFNTRRAMRNILKDASEALVGYDLSDLFMHGMLNEILGVSASSRIGAGDFVPGSRLGTADADQGKILQQVLGAPYAMLHDFVANAGKLGAGVLTGDWKQAADALRAGGPVAIRNVIKGLEQLDTGYASNAKGQKIQDVSTLSAVLQLTGLSNAGVARAQELESIKIQTMAFYNQFSQELQNDLVRAIKAGDTAKIQEIADLKGAWNQQYPHLQIMPNAAATRRAVAISDMSWNRRSEMMLSRRHRAAFTDLLGEEAGQ